MGRDFLMMATDIVEDWLFDAIEFYRPRGFFHALKDTDDELVDRLLPYIEEQQTDAELTLQELESPEFDLFLLSFDPMRTLYESLDFGSSLGPGLGAYVEVLKALARISRGSFLPTDLHEHWDGPDGPIFLRFQWAGKEHQLKVDTWGGVFDFRLLLQLNSLIWDTPYRYEMAPMDDILFVTVLTAQEKTDLERLRGLSFMVLDLPRSFLPLGALSPPLLLSEDPEIAAFYCGTLNENLDRCVGRLRFVLRGTTIEGHHRFEGDAHQEDLDFEGELDHVTGLMKGMLQGVITVGGEPRPYEGEWEARLAPGHRVITGTWRGWFVLDAGLEGVKQERVVYRGQLGLLEEDSLTFGDPYVGRAHAWLELVWACHNPDDYPWLYP